jgi:hypothetical protein
MLERARCCDGHVRDDARRRGPDAARPPARRMTDTARGARAQILMRGRAVTRRLVGWREWVALPELGIAKLPAKVDTGARTSALHAVDIRPERRADGEWVRFVVPEEVGRTPARQVHEARVCDVRDVKSSTGDAERRIVILTTVQVAERRFQVEVTLSDRSEMEFPMLIGRNALRAGRLLVHPSRSFLQGQPRA